MVMYLVTVEGNPATCFVHSTLDGALKRIKGNIAHGIKLSICIVYCMEDN